MTVKKTQNPIKQTFSDIYPNIPYGYESKPWHEPQLVGYIMDDDSPKLTHHKHPHIMFCQYHIDIWGNLS